MKTETHREWRGTWHWWKSSSGVHRLILHWQGLVFTSAFENSSWKMESSVSYRGEVGTEGQLCVLSLSYTWLHQKGHQRWFTRLRSQAKHKRYSLQSSILLSQIHINKPPSAEPLEHLERMVCAIWTKMVTPALPIIKSNFKISDWLMDLCQCL